MSAERQSKRPDDDPGRVFEQRPPLRYPRPGGHAAPARELPGSATFAPAGRAAGRLARRETSGAAPLVLRETYVDRDRNLEIRYCHPRSKTKSFALVPPDGEMQKRPN